MTLLSRLRRVWLDVHLWVGAGLLIALMPLAVTGSILVWHDQLDHALYASRYATTEETASRPVSDYAAAAEGAFGERAKITQLRFPQRAGDPVVAVGGLDAPVPSNGRPRTLNVWLNPADARVLGEPAEVNAQPTMVLHRIHGSLLIPEIGRRVVGWLGWAMFVSSVTGLWLWWPRHGGVLRGLRWRRGASTMFNLHHLIGFWVCVPLAVLSLTGVYISFPQTSRALFGLPQLPARAAGPGRNAPPITPVTPVDAAVLAAGGGTGETVREVNWPTKGRSPAWRITLREGAPVRIADATGQAQQDPDRAGEPPRVNDPTSRLMRRIHDGADMGILWRLIITLAGAAPAVLGVTGVIMWLRRRARRGAISRGVA